MSIYPGMNQEAPCPTRRLSSNKGLLIHPTNRIWVDLVGWDLVPELSMKKVSFQNFLSVVCSWQWWQFQVAESVCGAVMKIDRKMPRYAKISSTFMVENHMSHRIHGTGIFSSTFTINTNQMQVNIPYMDPMGVDI